MTSLKVACCVVGGGPAGMMLGLLLARAGVEVAVLEKHADFFRDFRGDTIHPSTLQIMDELGLLDGLLRIRHSELRELTGKIGTQPIKIADFSRVPGRCKFMAVMPQWDFLSYLAQQAHAYPSFHLFMEAEATELVRTGDTVTGVIARMPQGSSSIEAGLVVACDGRHSTMRERAGLSVIDRGAPIDVLWMRISRKADDPAQTFGTIAPGAFLVTIDRTDYYQCAFLIRKNGFSEVQARGLEAFREQIATLAPYLRDRVNEIASWDDVKLLTVKVDRLKTWHQPGLLCIGDAAHAMSPVGGVGINLAIQDAVAAANLLYGPLRRGPVTSRDLHAVQRRREFPTRVTQAVQVAIQNRFLNRVVSTTTVVKAPLAFRFLRFAAFRRLLARVVGIGVRPEHVQNR